MIFVWEEPYLNQQDLLPNFSLCGLCLNRPCEWLYVIIVEKFLFSGEKKKLS